MRITQRIDSARSRVWLAVSSATPDMKPMSGLVLLIMLFVVTRIAIALAYTPAYLPDTASYVACAEQLAELSHYTAVRTPVYPLFLKLFHFDPARIVLVQVVLAGAKHILLFMIILKITRKTIWALAGASVSVLAINSALLERCLMTEELSSGLVVAALACLLLYSMKKKGGYPLGLASVFFGLATLTRPQFVLLPLAAIPLVFMASRTMRWKHAAILVLPYACLVAAWITFNWYTIGRATLTTNSYTGLINHIGLYCEHAPERYADLAALHKRVRDEHLARLLAQHDNISSLGMWFYPAVREQRQIGYLEMSDLLTRYAVATIWHNPVRYMKSVCLAFRDYWRCPLIYSPQNTRHKWFLWLWPTVKYGLVALNGLFLVLFMVVLLQWLVNAKWRCDLYTLTLALLILCSAITQALFERGENPRYGIPLQCLVPVAVILLARSSKGAES